jgi:hypothetical protein
MTSCCRRIATRLPVTIRNPQEGIGRLWVFMHEVYHPVWKAARLLFLMLSAQTGQDEPDVSFQEIVYLRHVGITPRMQP